MCGRFTVIKSKEELEKRFGAKVSKNQYQKRYNAAPSQELPVITNSAPKLVQFYKWGLIPFWAKDKNIGYRLINAKAETITQKPSFRNAIKERRCLVCADGYYEWKNTKEGKIPYRISLKGDELFAFAGIWEVWSSSEGQRINSFSIITVESNEQVKGIHQRMPVILTPEEE
ncbi:MAG: SOS response-associated peptidase, partial [Candidatus Marinimicrobia bacterium]|nr:SOS response-associated peptidase [Candidatus Neomarinimicrobiota bacterium]